METPLQFAYRTQKSIGILDAAPLYQPLSGFICPEGNLRCCTYSLCGRYFAWASSESVVAVDALTGDTVAVLYVTNVYEIGFSPRGNFLVTWERPSKDEAGDANKNLKVWQTIDDSMTARCPLGGFVQKSQGSLNMQYAADERYCVHLVTNEVHFYGSHDLRTVWNKLRAEGVTDFSLAPGSTESVAVFIPGRNGQPATVKIFNVPNFTSPVSQKNFFKGDKVQMKWNKLGTSLLVLAQTDVDKSNKSYYGETTLYLLSVNGSFDARVALDKEGPIHDVCWSPNSREFAVVYGFMPAKSTIFSHRAVATHSFPIGPRNTVIFSPTGRFAILAGFGNLMGQMDIYDLERDFAKICTIESGTPSVCQWSPDSRFILTATTSPRLRVDNGVRIWHVSGSLIYHQDMMELYNVLWRPASDDSPPVGNPLSPIPAPHSSAVTYLGTKSPVKPAGAYRPPGARGLATPLAFKREDEGGAAHVAGNGTSSLGANGFGRGRRTVPGADSVDSPFASHHAMSRADSTGGDEALSKTALKNKKKRVNKKAKEDGELKQNPEATDDVTFVPLSTGAPTTDDPVPTPERSRASHQRIKITGGLPRGTQPRRRRSDALPDGDTSEVPNSTPPPTADAHDHINSSHGEDFTLIATTLAQDSVQNSNAKKFRSLTKKIRAIEELEMRHAGGEKLEDTQIKKIATKQDVMFELDALDALEISADLSGHDIGGRGRP